MWITRTSCDCAGKCHWQQYLVVVVAVVCATLCVCVGGGGYKALVGCWGMVVVGVVPLAPCHRRRGGRFALLVSSHFQVRNPHITVVVGGRKGFTQEAMARLAIWSG